MPSQPAWFHRLDEILETLRGMESTHLDRQAVQKLFGVRERRARQLMAGLPGMRAGNAFAASRSRRRTLEVSRVHDNRISLSWSAIFRSDLPVFLSR